MPRTGWKALIEQLKTETEPSMVLHLVVSSLYFTRAVALMAVCQSSLVKTTAKTYFPRFGWQQVILLFQKATKHMLHTPGKLVPAVVDFLVSRAGSSDPESKKVPGRTSLGEPEIELIRNYQKMVMTMLVTAKDDPTDIPASAEAVELTAKLKVLVIPPGR